MITTGLICEAARRTLETARTLNARRCRQTGWVSGRGSEEDSSGVMSQAPGSTGSVGSARWSTLQIYFGVRNWPMGRSEDRLYIYRQHIPGIVFVWIKRRNPQEPFGLMG